MWSRRKTLLASVAVLLLAGGGVAWVERAQLLAWYYLRGLDGAGEADRDLWAERVAGLGAAAVPGLLERLDRGDDLAGENARATLARLVRRWPADDSRGAELARRLSNDFRRLSPAGQRQALRLACEWLAPEGGAAPGSDVVRALAGLPPEAVRAARGPALELAALLLERPDATDWLAPCRELAQACFVDEDAANRARAVELALCPGMDLQKQVLPLLHDPAPEVRRLAILVLGPATDVIVTEDLLRWLHDPDAEVRRLCEMALRGRKLSANHIRLGRYLTAGEAGERLEVLDHLRTAADLDPGVWLRHLSHDAKPSVRAAAMRAAVLEYPEVPFSDRLEQMRGDPSPTVGQLAHYYLPLKKQQEAPRP